MLRKVGSLGDRPVTLDEAKDHCEVDYADKDDLIGAQLDAALEFVADRTGLAVRQQSYRMEMTDWWAGCLDVPVMPVRDVTAVKYIDADGAEQTVDVADYRWSLTATGAVVELLSTFTAPAVLTDRADAVRIEFDAGYDVPGVTGSGDNPDLVLPVRIKQIVLMLVSFWLNNRDAVAASGVMAVPMGAEALMAQVRVYR
jgi:uncharacterized phiE125 gp8 family phage protein